MDSSFQNTKVYFWLYTFNTAVIKIWERQSKRSTVVVIETTSNTQAVDERNTRLQFLHFSGLNQPSLLQNWTAPTDQNSDRIEKYLFLYNLIISSANHDKHASLTFMSDIITQTSQLSSICLLFQYPAYHLQFQK